MKAQNTLTFAAILAIALFAGCGGDAGTEPAPSSDPEGGVSQPEPTPETDQGEAADATGEPVGEPESSTAKATEGIPEDIFIAEGAKSTQRTEIGDKQNLILEYPATDADTFVQAYQDGMKEKGWSLAASSKLPIGTISNFTKDDRKCTVSISPPKEDVIKVAIMF